MRLAPGGLPWLVLWDLRIRVRLLAIGRLRPLAVVLYSLFAIVAHAVAGLVLWSMLHAARPMAAGQSLAFASSLLSFLVFFMLMAALLGGFRTAFAGRELSLHLSAPLPFARVLWMRTLSLVAGTWTAAVLLAIPAANMGAILGHPRFLLIYPVTIGLAICAVALTLVLVAGTLRLFGVARGRKLLQAAQVVVPLAFVLSSTLRHGTATPGTRAPGSAGFSIGGFDRFADALQLPARALRGDPDALLLFALICGIALWLAVRMVRSALLAALQAPDTAAPSELAKPGAKPIAAQAARFGRPLWLAILMKEWRTILRDPRLASALLVQPLVVLPFFYLNLMHGRFRLAGAAAAATFVAAQMSQFVANLMISAEEAPSLLGAAPVRRAALIRYKCLAALLPVCGLMLLPALWLGLDDLWIGAVCLLCVLGAGFCACAVEVARPYPAPRRSFVQMQAARRKRDPLDLLGVLLIQIGWTAGAWFLASRNGWGALIVFGVILVPFFEWWRDANRQSLLGY